MNRLFIISALLAIVPLFSFGHVKDTLLYKGQLSAWTNYNLTGDDLAIGGRYIPQVNLTKHFSEKSLFDLELSANIYLNWYSNADPYGEAKPYRVWTRYSTPQFEIRAGLQKINFGSATMLRPLMWFDQMDPRDPLQLTDGVWGLLGRYYFLNNANIWLWGLYGNEDPKGWEVFKTEKGKPEFGGRIQLPVFIGEAAISYHHRLSYFKSFTHDMYWADYNHIPEDKLGFDTKIDWIVGFWVEGSRNLFGKDLERLINHTLLNIGTDYTFGIGNGLLAVYEHLFILYDKKPLFMKKEYQFSLFSLSYPIGIFDNLSAMVYYSWDMDEFYTFLNWQRTYNRISLHLMAYWNPETFNLPQQNLSNNLFGGKGVQFMFVFNH
jgi:hypothetical protein